MVLWQCLDSALAINPILITPVISVCHLPSAPLPQPLSQLPQPFPQDLFLSLWALKAPLAWRGVKMPPNLNSDDFCSAVPVAVPPSSAELPPCPHPAGIAHFFIPYGFYCSALSVELEHFLMQPLEFPRLPGLVSPVSTDNPGGLPKAQTGPRQAR